MRDVPYRPFQPRPKASEWRWLAINFLGECLRHALDPRLIV